MRHLYGERALVTGATSGIGRSVALALAKEGYKVIGASRSAEDGEVKGGVGYVSMDVTDEASVIRAVKAAAERLGGIDVLVNCAGSGIAGAAEDISAEELLFQMDVNFLGVSRVCGAVLPYMRGQKRGMIVNIGSVAGYICIPFQSSYSASKFAVDALTQAIRMECAPFGIKASLVAPGDTKTGFTAGRKLVRAFSGSVYEKMARRAIYSMEKSEQDGKPPETVAKAVLRVLEKENPPVRTTVGFEYKLIYAANKLLPAKLVSRLVYGMYTSKPLPDEGK